MRKCLPFLFVLPFVLFISTVAVVSFAATSFATAETIEYRVSSKGGTPFQTLAQARDQIRADKQAGKTGPWCVTFEAGEYPMTEPVVFTAEDSGTADAPIVYRGSTDPQAKTELTGGVELTGWRLADEPGVWVADLPELDGRTLYFEQLFINGRRAVRARYPDAGFLTPEAVQQEVFTDPTTQLSTNRQSLTPHAHELDLLQSVPTDELRWGQVIVHHNWNTTRRILRGFDPATGTIFTQGVAFPRHNPWCTSSLCCIENVRSAFNQPGEWFYDGNAKKVFYRPLEGETLETSRFVVPRPGLKQLLLVKGESAEKPVTNLRFENLTFEYTDTPRRPKVMEQTGFSSDFIGDFALPGPSQFDPAQAAFYTDAVLDIQFAENIQFEHCAFTHLGEYCTRIHDANACVLEDCEMTDLGAGGVRIGHNASRNRVENCEIRSGGRFHASAVGVWIGEKCNDNVVSHCEIADLYYTGVSVGWSWGYHGEALRNQVVFNYIHDIGQGALSDMGGVYTLGTQTGTCVSNNVICNVRSYGYGGWGLYTDEGSEGITLENNLVYETHDGSFHQHYGKNNVVRNNILVCSHPNPATPDTPARQIAVTRPEEHRSFTFENNIVYWKAGGTALGGNFPTAKVDFHSNLWWNADGAADFYGKTHDEYFTNGQDAGGQVADPLFYDVEQKDFRLRPESPALQMGFKPFDYTQAGRKRP